jgi:CubicO group peptidase (beta-lactamase class C family)
MADSEEVSMHLWIGLLLLLLTPPVGENQPAQTLPDTPAGRQLAEWIDVFNRHDPAALREFISGRFSREALEDFPADRQVVFYGRIWDDTRGLLVRQLESSSAEKVSVLAQGVNPEIWLVLTLTVTNRVDRTQEPHPIARLTVELTDAPVAGAGQPDLREPLVEDRFVDLLSAYLDSLAQLERISGTVLVARDATPLFDRSYGYANKATQERNDLTTRFAVPSLNKMFTTVALAQLAQQGRLSLSDPLERYVRGDSALAVTRPLTIRDLLAHSSGPDFWLNRFEREHLTIRSDSLHPPGRDSIFESLMGGRFRVRDSLFVVLGAIIERVADTSYRDYVRSNIFAPAGMTTSTSVVDDSIGRYAIGYAGTQAPAPPSVTVQAQKQKDSHPHATRSVVHRRRHSQSTPANQQSTPSAHTAGAPRAAQPGGPAGGGYSSADDLLKFSLALQTQRLVNAPFVDSLFEPRAIPGQERPSENYSPSSRGMSGQRVIGLATTRPGAQALCEIYLDSHYTMVVLSNDDRTDFESITQKLRQWIPRLILASQHPVR